MTHDMNGAQSAKSVAIIGAGMAGITAARTLQARGFKVSVFEKSRGLSGRMSTRVSRAGFQFDHGAQFITAKGAAFRSFLDEAVSLGSASLWNDPDFPAHTQKQRYVGAPAMNQLLVPFARDLDVQFGTTTEPIQPEGKSWRVRSMERGDHGLFDIVISTVPSEQAKHLSSAVAAFAPSLAIIEMAPCWSLMLAFEDRIEPGFSVYQNQDGAKEGPFGWIARNSGKPGRDPTTDQWIVHANPDWSIAHLELEKEDVANRLLMQFRQIAATDFPQPLYKAAHRWRYAMTTQPLGKPFLCDDSETFYLGGDWCLGARVESAFDSALAMANAILTA